jgi:hypothetical protein
LSLSALVAPDAGLAEISDPNNRKNINFMAYKMMGGKLHVKCINIVLPGPV